MYMLSATEAISPALNRTRDFLFRPFRWGNYLKFCAVAVLTEGTWANLRSNGGGTPSTGGNGRGVPFNIDPGMIAALIACVILLMVLGVALMYVVVRLRFALFHSLVHRSRELATGWHMYREQAMRFFVLSIVVAVGFLAVAAVALAPFVPGFIRVFRESQAGRHLMMGDLLPLVLQLGPVILLLMLAGVAVDVVMRDFMLPHMALENATAGEAWTAALERVMEEKGTFFLYAVLRVMLPFAATIALTVVLMIPMIIVFGIPGVLFALVHAAQVHATGAAWLLAVLLEVVLGIFMLPHMALENATAGEAWTAALERVMEEKGTFFLYAVLRVMLPFAATIALTVVLIIPMVIVFGIPGVLFALVHAAQVHATGAAWLLAVLLEVVLGIFMLAIGALMAICFGGPVSIAIRNYALVFYGGRYELLGNLLVPPQTEFEAPPLPA